MKSILLICSVLTALPLAAQTPSRQDSKFEVATIKPTPPEDRGRYIRMQSTHQFQAKGFTLRALVSAAYDLPPRFVTGGAEWIDLVRYDIAGLTPGEGRPSPEQQMAMVRQLLQERFNFGFHTERKEVPGYVLTVAKGGAKLKRSAAAPDDAPVLVNSVSPTQITLPARNATMTQFASMMQRAVLDKPIQDKTGLSARYDFDLEWTADETQFGGNLPRVPPENVTKPPLFDALEQQLGLRLESSRVAINTIVIDRVEKPTDN
jgi:uncharacterized protein (TIGR03435 family)